MSEKKILVPEGMLKAFRKAENHEGRVWDGEVLEAMLTAALRWLAENPIVPTPEQALAMSVTKPVLDGFDNWELVRWGACEWQRRMFVAPEPEIPEAIKQAICDGTIKADPPMTRREYDAALMEAYRRGALSQNEK